VTRRILVIGSINTDLVTFVDRMPEAGETLGAQDFVILPGGKGANQAVAAARLGADVAMIGRVGDDPFGTSALQSLRAEGIDTEGVAVSAGVPSGVATILVETSGENRILIVAGANGLVLPSDVPDTALQAASLVVLQLEIPLPTVADVIARATALGVKVLLNPAPAASLDPDMLRGVTYLVPNRDELGRLTGLMVSRTDDIVAAARRLVRHGVGSVIVTLGGDGALLVTQARVAHVEAPKVSPVDTTGAGDAFIGCFAQTLVATGDVDAALARAVRYAADSVTRRGAQGSYGRQDVLF
jgi:ribokinase